VPENLRRSLARSLKDSVAPLLGVDFQRLRQDWTSSSNDCTLPFFGVSEQSGKDNSGNPVYEKNSNGTLNLDEHGHLIIKTI